MAPPPLEEPSLTVLSGSLGGTVFVVDDSTDNVLIGSDPSCRFALPDTAVDPIHARLWIDLEGITVYDTNSPRGVYINDDRVQGQARLRNGDILWLGPPGDEQSVMLQCRLPGTTDPGLAAAAPAPAAAAAPADAPPADAPPPVLEPAAALMAIDLDPTVPLLPEPVVTPEPEVPADDASADSFSLDEPTPAPGGLLAPDAIQPEPTVMLAPEDAFIEPEPTIAMLPDDVELSSESEPPPTVSLSGAGPIEEPRATSFTGWDPTAGGITEAADAPWLAGAPATAPEPEPEPEPYLEPDLEPEPTATVVPVAPAPPRAPEPPPAPVAAPKPAAAPVARAAATGAAAAGAAATKASRPASPEPRPSRAPERPPAPKPRREAARPPDDAPPPRKGAPMGLLIGGGLAAAVAVAAVGWWMLTRGPAAPEGGTVAPPSTVADAAPATLPPAATAVEPEVTEPAPAPEAPVEEEVTIVPRASPTPVPSRAPALTPPPTQVAAARPPVTAAPAALPPAAVAAGLVARAEAARQAGDLDGAAELFDQALRADSSNAAATSGKAAVTAARAAARKAFMPGRTVVQTQSAKADLSGFDTADVSVKKAPDFSGRLEFAVNPPKVKPGDNYSVQIYLVNEGKKAIKVSGVSVTTNVNGSKAGRSLSSRVKEVAPSQRALIEELPGVWPEDVNWWSTEVLVTANKGDSLKNLLTWK